MAVISSSCRFLLPAVLFGAVVMLPRAAVADQLEVVDCSGATRAMEQIGSGDTRAVSVRLADGTNAEVVATGPQGDAQRAASNLSSARFEAFTSGRWQVCAGAAEISLVTIEPRRSRAAVAAIGGAVVGGTGLVLAGLTRGSSSSEPEVISDGGTGLPIVGPQGSGGSLGSGSTHVSATSSGKGGKGCSCGDLSAQGDDCRDSESPDPLSPWR